MPTQLPFEHVPIFGPSGVVHAKLVDIYKKTFVVRMGTPPSHYEFFLLSGKSRKLGDRFVVQEETLLELRKARRK